MKLVHSHNDYWCEHPFWDAIEYGCNMVEGDIIYYNGKLMLGHSWKPFPSCYCGELEQTYFQPMHIYCKQHPETLLWLYLEYKSGSKNINPILYSLMKKYKLPNLNYAISAIPPTSSTIYRKERYERAIEFLTAYKSELGVIWEAELEAQYEYERVDLFKDSFWHF